MRTIILKNTTNGVKTYVGQTIAANGQYQLQVGEDKTFALDNTLFADVASGDIVVSNGTSDFYNPTEGWNWIVNDTPKVEVEDLPFSSSLGLKLAVHSSPKPEPEDMSPTYAVWTGAGDKFMAGSPPQWLPEENTIGGGELFQFTMSPGAPTVIKDIKFDPRHGRVWIHQAYIRYNNAGIGDTMCAAIIAPPTPLQTMVDLDYVIVDGWLKYAGPGMGTHGLAGTPVLAPRTFAKDGFWDFDGVNLTPNFGPGGSPDPGSNGQYHITAEEKIIHRYITRVPLYGDSGGYFRLTSWESDLLPIDMGYFIRVKIMNGSNQFWNLSAILEIYRERTHVP